MRRQEGHKHTQINFNAAAEEFRNDGRYQEHRRPQWNISNESSPSIAQRRVARNMADQMQDLRAGRDMDEDYFFVDHSGVPKSCPSSESTGSDDTVIGSAMASTGQPPAVLGSALTADNMSLHDKVQPLGTTTTYEWVHGQKCPGDLDLKDISSRESMRVRRDHSRISPSTIAVEDEYGVVNHPSEAYIVCAGDWADVAALPSCFDKTLRI